MGCWDTWDSLTNDAGPLYRDGKNHNSAARKVSDERKIQIWWKRFLCIIISLLSGDRSPTTN